MPCRIVFNPTDLYPYSIRKKTTGEVHLTHFQMKRGKIIWQPGTVVPLTAGLCGNAIGLDNSSAVLVGAQEQLFAFDESPRARVGEPILDPGPNEFPVKLCRAAHLTRRERPSPSSPTSSTRTPGQSSATRRPSPARPASEGPN